MPCFLLQLLVATPLETEQGHCKTLFVYLGGILFGALGSALFNPSQAMIGASAGVYSLLISHISHSVLVSDSINTLRKIEIHLNFIAAICFASFFLLFNSNRTTRLYRIYGLAYYLWLHCASVMSYLYPTML